MSPVNPNLERGSAIRWMSIDINDVGQRIDNFLFTRLKGIPKSRIYRCLRRGEIRVNGRRIKAHYRLQLGDSVRIPPLREGNSAARPRPGANVLSLIENRIIYETAGFLVLNKPAGIAVHGGSGMSFGVIEALRQLRSESPFLELVHRLDRETSGCLLIAKRRGTLRALHEALRTGRVRKVYNALLMGRWHGGVQRVNASLGKKMRSGERIVSVSEDGKTAETVFSPVQYFAEATLVDVLLKTGRTHQIRVHAAHLGVPVAGDDKYGHAHFNQRMRQCGLRRLFLHAASLSFELKDSGPFTVKAPLGDDLSRVLAHLVEIAQRHGS
jgi:23S rRNA pseudouridine955/2504/2580 synthase